MRKGKHSSVQWRIILIYFVLVFIAMTVVSVFLLDRIEAYQINSLEDNITNTVNRSNLLTTLGRYDDLEENAGQVQSLISDSWSGSFSDELSVVSKDLNICASSNQNLIGKTVTDVFDVDVALNAMNRAAASMSDGSSGSISIKNLCYPISGESGDIIGVVYVRADLSSINSLMKQSRIIFIQATLIALTVTIVLGFILARSITVPINDVTDKVIKMSQGDFSTEVSVKSDDEIGQLAEMFNLLREKLDYTLSEISNEKNKLGTILEYMGDGLIAIDLEGNIIHVNPAVLSMLGRKRPPEDMRYESLLGNISENLSLEKVKASCEESGGEAVFDHKDTIFAVRYDRFKDEAGCDAGIIFIMQDITERQKLENMQTDFVANVSHELKTPLTNIKSYTETLLDGAIDDRETAMSFLSIVDSEADRMNRLVKDLLQLSRMDNMQEQMHLKESNIVALVNMAVMKMEMSVQQKAQQMNQLYDIEMEIRCDVDRDRFEQVIINILSNAIKYTQDGGRIDIDIYDDEANAYISVQDNGIGIPEGSLPRIFERFYRVDKARSRSMGGTGLGLAITKQIIEGHNGSISAESSEGHGTKMTVKLPLSHHKGKKNIE